MDNLRDDPKYIARQEMLNKLAGYFDALRKGDSVPSEPEMNKFFEDLDRAHKEWLESIAR